ncbi:MAG: peptidoglycan DD-metalloendopeptidase family protein [Parcubacteria group bacterium]
MRLLRQLKLFLLVALIMGIGLGLKPLPVGARSVEEIAGEINTLNGQVQRLDSEIAKLQQQIEQKGSEIRSYRNEIERLSVEIDTIGLEIQNTETKIERTNKEIEKTEIEIRTKEKEINETKKVLAEYIRLINDADQVNVIEILLSGKSFSEILNQFEYTETLQKKTQEGLEQIKQLKGELEAKQAELERQRNDALVLRTQLEGQREALTAKRAQKDRLLALSEEEQKNYENLLAENEAQQKQALDDIRQLEQELLSKTGGIPSGAIPAGAGVLMWPANGTVTQEYGNTPYSEGGAYGGADHNGLDIAAPMGSPIYAADDGVVSATGDLGGVAYGRWLSINHSKEGFDTLYGHLLSIKVSKGDTVKRGQVVAAMGSTGYSTGAHVHFMVCFNLQTTQRPYGLLPYCNHVNPRLYL